MREFGLDMDLAVVDSVGTDLAVMDMFGNSPGLDADFATASVVAGFDLDSQINSDWQELVGRLKAVVEVGFRNSAALNSLAHSVLDSKG